MKMKHTKNESIFCFSSPKLNVVIIITLLHCCRPLSDSPLKNTC